MKLNDCDLLRLFLYYNDYSDHSSHPADCNKGGRDMVERTLTEAASRIPMRFLTLLPKIEWENLQTGYITSLLSGAADHLRYRFGRLRPPAKTGKRPNLCRTGRSWPAHCWTSSRADRIYCRTAMQPSGCWKPVAKSWKTAIQLGDLSSSCSVFPSTLIRKENGRGSSVRTRKG